MPEEDVSPVTSPTPRRPNLAAFSLIAAPASWALLYVARTATTNVTILLLWIAAAVTLAGLVLAILALRNRTANRLLAFAGIGLNLITFVLFVLLGVSDVLLSL